MRKEQTGTSIKINDVAKMAGVSISTVSRVMNGSKKVSKETAKRVQKAIDAMGYVPNEMARSLATNNSKIVGMLIPDIFNGYYAELTTYIEPLLSAQGYSLQLCITGADKDKISYYFDDLIRRRAAGAIVLSARNCSRELIQRVKNNMAIVAIEGDIEDVDRICVENEKGTYDAVENLILHGHTKIGFVGYHLKTKGLWERLQGYRKAMAEYHLTVNEEYIIDEMSNANPGYEGTMRLLDLPEPPTAIQCMNEYCARGVYMALMERGIKIPEDMSVSAFDGQINTKVLSPRLTTAAIPMKDIAEAAVKMLIQSVQEGMTAARHMIVFPVELKQGKSVKKI